MKIAIYARYSKDEVYRESNTLENQISICHSFLDGKKEFVGAEISEYSDNNFTGINLERPSVQRLLLDVRMRKINVIIVKDFSRLSREHLDFCMLIDKIFPFMDVRFISVLDCFDSVTNANKPLELSVAFKAILNEFHVLETSAKVRKTFEIKIANGEFTSGALPYGYYFEAKNSPAIAEKEAENVRKIFNLRNLGKSFGEIAGELNKAQIPAPKGNVWCISTIENMLKNRAYIGEKIYHKREKNIKTKRSHINPPEKWIVRENAFSPIISEEIFNAVNAKTRIRDIIQKPQPKEFSPLAFKIKCGVCGSRLGRRARKTMRKGDIVYYSCRGNSTYGKGETCFSGGINENFLFSFVLEKVKERLGEFLQTAKSSRKVWSEKEKLECKLKNLKLQAKTNFERFADGNITKNGFLNEKKRLETETYETEKALAELLESQVLNDTRNGETPLEMIKRLYNSEVLTREHTIFIEKVLVYNSEKVEVLLENRNPIELCLKWREIC